MPQEYRAPMAAAAANFQIFYRALLREPLMGQHRHRPVVSSIDGRREISFKRSRTLKYKRGHVPTVPE
jgi:hypothetical protein